MSAGEAAIRKRVQEALGRDQHYVSYLRAEDVDDLIRDLDDARLRAGLVAVQSGASIIVRPSPSDGIVTAAMLTPTEEAVLDAAGPQYAAALDRLLDPVRGYSEPTTWRQHMPPTPPPEGFAALYVTFGQRYVRQPHETGLPWPHPDGFLTVHYRDVEEVEATYVAPFGGATYPRTAHERARQTVMAYLGGHFATSYSAPPVDFVPWGEMALMVLP